MRILILIVPLLLPAAISAQSEPDDDDLQLWNDLEFNIPLNDKVVINTVGTLRLGENVSKVDSYRFTIGATYKPVKAFSLAPFTTFISSRASSGRYRYEYRHGIKARYMFPTKAFSLSHQSRVEHRSRPGRNSWRYRPSITIEKDLPESFVKGASVFLTEEPFYDSVSGKFSRNRISAGIEKEINKKFSIELYYLFQGDNFSTPGSVHVLGTTWKVSL